MLKTAFFDCEINEKCWSVDEGRGICPVFSSPPRGIWQLKCPHPREFAIQGKKMLMPGAQTGEGEVGLGAAGIDWCIIETKIATQGRTRTFRILISYHYTTTPTGHTQTSKLFFFNMLNQ